MNTFIPYTTQEIFNILRINQEVFAQIDKEVDVKLVEKHDSILNWRKMNDLDGWVELYKHQNKIFDLSLSQFDWIDAVMPEQEKTVWQLCEFIATHAKKEVIQPVKIMGIDCLSAAIFFSLKKDLAKYGLDVENIKPSSPISFFTDYENFPKLVAVVSRKGVSLSDSIKLKHELGNNFLQMLVEKIYFYNSKKYIDTGGVKTFRDLTLRILKNELNCIHR